MIASVAAGLNGSPSSSQPKLLSTAASAISLKLLSDEAFAIYELSIAFPDLTTEQSKYDSTSVFYYFFYIMLDTVIACCPALCLLNVKIVRDDADIITLYSV